MEDVKSYFEELDRLNNEIDKRETIISELKRDLKKINEEVIDLRTFYKQARSIKEEQINVAKELERFEERNEMLTRQREKEIEYNSFLEQVEEEYYNFYNDLTTFKLDLEKERISNIEEKILNFYLQINNHDDISERISNIEFKLIKDNYRIYVKKLDSSQMDACTCLSEGHLRALGLSLMLAVAEKNKVPFLIFDDVVNAIDSDHRANIINMLFNDSFLESTQLIITTHDRLFWERFCNQYSTLIDRKNVNNISYIINHTNKGSVLTQYNVGFESKIREALKRYDIRQALIYCRIWFETIATNYCVKEKAELTGKFTNVSKSNLLQVSLESIYAKLNEVFPDNENLKSIKKDLINWKAQNEEHHSFDEHSLNFVHSKNSNEVSNIYKSIKRFINDMDPHASISQLESDLKVTENKLTKSNFRLQSRGFLENAGENKVQIEQELNMEYKFLKEEITKEITRLKQKYTIVSQTDR
ncbi:hypothetical protein [Virgibacillus salexigens]|uniref:hypothetical protein n=1 Tax=Virgibacillus salexigens TaxID=61016 RepID=UPI003081F743